MFTLLILAVVIYNLFSAKLLRNIVFRFGFIKPSRIDYYECGFKPTSQKPIKISIQYLLIILFFLIYDIELTLLVPILSTFVILTFIELNLIYFFIFLFLISLMIDFERKALNWQV